MLHILGSPHLFEDSPLGFTVADAAGRFVRVNRTIEAITGYSERELLSRDFQSITHPEDLAANLGIWRRMYSTAPHSSVFEKRYVRADGSPVLVRNSVTVVPDESGALAYSMAITEPVGEVRAREERVRRDARAILAAHDEQLRSVSRALHDGPAQSLTVLGLNLALKGGAAEAVELVSTSAEQVRVISHALYPPQAEETGLRAALETWKESLQRAPGLELRLQFRGRAGCVDPALEATAFRIVQDTLWFLTQAPAAARVEVERLANELRLVICAGWERIPDGKLAAARMRAEAFGGRMDAETGASGVTLKVSLPLSR